MYCILLMLCLCLITESGIDEFGQLIIISTFRLICALAFESISEKTAHAADGKKKEGWGEGEEKPPRAGVNICDHTVA